MTAPAACVIGVMLALPGAGASLQAQRPTTPNNGSTVEWHVCAATAPAAARCGTLRVPENRAAPDGRRVTLALYVVRAHGSARAEDPVLVLLGGPGDAATHRLAALVSAHAAINRERDLVLVDQRGVGRSSPLPCTHGSDDDLQSYMDFLDASAVRACIASIGGTADPARYRTRDFILDLEDLRRALGIRQWNLHANSYGTRVAQQYLARHPASIRAAVLMAAVPKELAMPEPFGADADRALDMLLAACAADGACRAAFPALRNEIDSVSRRLARAPAVVSVAHPVSGAPTNIRFGRAAFGEAVRAALYTPAGASTIPLAIHEASRGNYAAIAGAHLRRQRTIAREGWTGLYLAATCPEDVARLQQSAVLAANRSSILGEYRARQHFAACALWPAGLAGDDWPATPRIDTPVLLIVGDADPVTPPRWSRLAQAHMTRSRLLEVAGGGHGFAGMIGVECLAGVQAGFFASANPAAADAGCVAAMKRPPFVTTR